MELIPEHPFRARWSRDNSHFHCQVHRGQKSLFNCSCRLNRTQESTERQLWSLVENQHVYTQHTHVLSHPTHTHTYIHMLAPYSHNVIRHPSLTSAYSLISLIFTALIIQLFNSHILSLTLMYRLLPNCTPSLA